MEKLNINPEHEQFEKDHVRNIKFSLENELYNMEIRNPKRIDKENPQKDIIYTILKIFVENLDKTNNFQNAFHKLSDEHKHAIIIRLENQDIRLGGTIPYDFIKSLSEKTYGTIKNEDNVNMINDKRKNMLAENLQKENKHIYNVEI